ncbi:hypothetical protein MTR_6g018980 [Medicago truncatula]|uniref:Uncharacterized protein n=1 Tax=Medicago truncatula TaxID=3880 RepID=A0A072U7Q8_MEDTR|nr:hypothetical protein MTR_6g018980 [Medicago truncatula]
MSPPICVAASIGGRDHCVCWDDSEVGGLHTSKKEEKEEENYSDEMMVDKKNKSCAKTLYIIVKD